MISANDVLQVISEIHQYSMLLLEVKESGTFGILQTLKERASYFKLQGTIGHKERQELVRRFYAREAPTDLIQLSVDEFLREIEGKKAKHIWLETVSPERKELAFLTIAELKNFLRSSGPR